MLIDPQILKSALDKELPGHQSALDFSTLKIRPETPSDARLSSVLLLINALGQITFIKRPEYDGVHSGQIAFPGGKQDPEDGNLLQTAHRETFEEIGIAPHQYEIVGALSPVYIPPSNFLVQPYVAFFDANIEYLIDIYEVKEVFEVNIEYLLNLNNQRVIEVQTAYGVLKTQAYVYQEYEIWGATAMILTEFLQLFKGQLFDNK